MTELESGGVSESLDADELARFEVVLLRLLFEKYSEMLLCAGWDSALLTPDSDLLEDFISGIEDELTLDLEPWEANDMPGIRRVARLALKRLNEKE